MKPRSRVVGIVVGLLCLILMVFMTAEITHSHAGIAGDGHCQFCTLAHVAIEAEPDGLTPLALLVLGLIGIGEPQAGSRAVLVTAFIRPPPPFSL